MEEILEVRNRLSPEWREVSNGRNAGGKKLFIT